MGRNDYVRSMPQRMVLGQRLRIDNVQPGAGNAAGVQRGEILGDNAFAAARR